MKDPRAAKSSRTRDTLVVGLVLLVFLAAIAFGILQLFFFSQQSKTSQVSDTITTSQSSVLGSSASNKTLTFTTESSEYLQQKETRYLHVIVTVENKSDDVAQVSPLLQFLAISSEGAEIPYTAEFTSGIAGGPLEAHTSSTLSVDFKVPAETTISSIRARETVSSEYNTILTFL